MVWDLRSFLTHLEGAGDLKRLSGVPLKHEIGAIAELAFEKSGPALLCDRFDGYPPDYRVAVNVCATLGRSLLAIGMDPKLSEAEAMAHWQRRWEAYSPVPPKVVHGGPVLENVQTGEEVDLTQFPVPIWHELDGGPYIGTGGAVILKDPDSGWVNLGCYRLQLQDRCTTTVFSEPSNDGTAIMLKYWKKGQACPVAVSAGPEPIIFLTASGGTGCPPRVPEYDYAGFVCGEPIDVIEGPVTGLPISARSEIAFEGEIPPPEAESRTEGPFGEFTGYYAPGGVPQPVIRVKALYYRTNPILFGAPPFMPRKETFSFSLPMRSVTHLLDRFVKAGLPVRRVAEIAKMGALVISVHQENEQDVERIIEAIDKAHGVTRLFILVDDDVNPEDPWEVMWAVGTRCDPTTGSRVSIVRSRWLLDPLRTTEERDQRTLLPYKRLILNGCRPFNRLNDFLPVNKFSAPLRQAAWEKWRLAEWLC